MTIKDYFVLTKNRLIRNKKSTLYSIAITAFSIFVCVFMVSMALSFVMAANKENFLFGFYMSLSGNRIEQLSMFIFVITNLVSAIMILAHFIHNTILRKNEFKNKLMLGATQANIAIEAVMENLVTYLIGTTIGILIAYIVQISVCAVFNIGALFSIYTFLVSAIIELVLVVISSIIPVFWLSTNE